MILFLVGFLVGGGFGFFLAAIVVAVSEEEDKHKRS